jgi:DNA anti-recombination protein RmuC
MIEVNRNRSAWRIAAACAALFVMAGCGERSEQPQTAPSAADVKKEAREAMESASDFAAAQRRQLVERARQSVQEVDRDLEDARETLGQLPDQARERLQEAIARAERAKEDLDDEVDDLQQASADRWKASQERLSAALDELKEARSEIAGALAGEKADPDRS